MCIYIYMYIHMCSKYLFVFHYLPLYASKKGIQRDDPAKAKHCNNACNNKHNKWGPEKGKHRITKEHSATIMGNRSICNRSMFKSMLTLSTGTNAHTNANTNTTRKTCCMSPKHRAASSTSAALRRRVSDFTFVGRPKREAKHAVGECVKKHRNRQWWSPCTGSSEQNHRRKRPRCCPRRKRARLRCHGHRAQI